MQNVEDSVIHFIKIGIIVLTIILLGFSVFRFIPRLVQVISVNAVEKKLPIYCVETEKKYVSLTFDAAWGNVI